MREKTKQQYICGNSIDTNEGNFGDLSCSGW